MFKLFSTLVIGMALTTCAIADDAATENDGAREGKKSACKKADCKKGEKGKRHGRKPCPCRHKKLLEKFDKDKDGKLSEEERAAAKAARAERKENAEGKERKGKRPPCTCGKGKRKGGHGKKGKGGKDKAE